MSGFPDYEVSDLGRVRRVSTGQEIQPWISNHEGYLRVAVYRDGRRKLYYLHRLVALHHVPGRCRRRWQVHHIDADPAKCVADNLRWTTPLENLAARNLGRGSRAPF